RSHSISAQGGINAALGNNPRGLFDSPEKHGFDTVKGSDYLADQDAALVLTRAAPGIVYEMENWGCPFSRDSRGRIAQRPFGGAGFPRTCYAADKTGHVLIHSLYQQVVRFEHASERQNMLVYDEWMVTRLVVEGGECRGVIARSLATGQLEAFMAEAVIFATGGPGRMYLPTTNALISTGLAVAIPLWAGVPLKDMEFIQFHPTTLLGTGILMTEGCRGEGGFLTNAKGERFLANYSDSAKAMEVAPRDIVARNMQREIDEGRGLKGAYIDLDLRHLGEKKIMRQLPGIRDLAMNFSGVDPVKEPIPVKPGHHYTMGGIDTNAKAETVIKGFYAAGECACVSVHGANRLGGNSLLETLVFGRIAGWEAADFIQAKSSSRKGEKALTEALAEEKARLEALTAGTGTESAAAIRDELGACMVENAGIFREDARLKKGLAKVKELQERFKGVRAGYAGKRHNQALTWVLELEGNLAAAEATVAGALLRRESRGAQFRTDFPTRDDQNFLKHTVATWSHGKGMSLSYRPVTLGTWEPKERKY
ncbi:MAG: FAD-binding protein, partial [Deltaproteobacteria bacterium]|nr:FAD-binding protein [Deltaproteobacteria bacterium]